MKKRKDYISDIFYSMNISKATFNKHLKEVLTKKQYEVYKMRFDKDGNIKMDNIEIANQLGISRQAVDILLSRIYKKVVELCKKLKIDVSIDERIDRPKVYNITEVREKTKELLLSIKTLKRLPKEKLLNNNQSERVFSDGTDQRRYYNALVTDVKRIRIKLEDGEEITKRDAQKLYDYKVIMKELSNYKTIREKPLVRTVNYASQVNDLRKKTDEFIKELNIAHKLPESKYADFFNTGKKFEDGTDQRNFYDALRYKGKVLKGQFERNEKLSELDIEKIISLKLIDNVLSFYPNRFYENKLLILELASSLEIDIEKNKLMLSKYFGEIYSKIRFLLDGHHQIIDGDGNINPFIYMTDEEMKEKYNISLEDLTSIYVNGVIDTTYAEEVIKKLSKK